MGEGRTRLLEIINIILYSVDVVKRLALFFVLIVIMTNFAKLICMVIRVFTFGRCCLHKFVYLTLLVVKCYAHTNFYFFAI